MNTMTNILLVAVALALSGRNAWQLASVESAGAATTALLFCIALPLGLLALWVRDLKRDPTDLSMLQWLLLVQAAMAWPIHTLAKVAGG